MSQEAFDINIKTENKKHQRATVFMAIKKSGIYMSLSAPLL